MKHVHPDIVVGEPVPEVEPRVNEVVLEHALAWTRGSRWVVALLLVLVVVFAIFRVSMTGRVIAAGVFYVGFIAWALRPSMREMRKNWKKPANKWAIPLRVATRFLIWQGLAILLLFILVMAGDGFSGMGLYIGLMALYGGGALIRTSWRTREPGQICCVDCEYPLVGLTIPCECPECGRVIYDASWTTDRPRVRSGWFVPVGVGLILFGGLIFYGSAVNPGLMYGSIPRAVLMKLASTDRNAFDELMVTPLSADEEQRLIDAMVANRTTASYQASPQQGQWLTQQIVDGRLTDAQLDVLFMEAGEIEIDAPKAARVGEPIELRLKAQYVRLPSFDVTPGYYFRGFVIGDDAENHAGSDSPRFRLYLTESVFQGESDVPRYAWTPSEAGAHQIRGRVVLALFLGGGHAVKVPIDWTQSGEGMFSVAPIWWMMVDLEHEIEVKP